MESLLNDEQLIAGRKEVSLASMGSCETLQGVALLYEFAQFPALLLGPFFIICEKIASDVQVYWLGAWVESHVEAQGRVRCMITVHPSIAEKAFDQFRDYSVLPDSPWSPYSMESLHLRSYRNGHVRVEVPTYKYGRLEIRGIKSTLALLAMLSLKTDMRHRKDRAAVLDQGKSIWTKAQEIGIKEDKATTGIRFM